MYRRTKIVSTLGPATDEPGILEKLIIAGVNVVRMNFSHGSAEDHKERARHVRELCAKHNTYIAILGDLQGPKIRVARFAEGPIQLEIGDKFDLDASLDRDAGNKKEVGIDYKELPRDVNPEDMLLLDDGRVVLKVESVDGSRIHTEVVVGGKLSNNKGINRQGGGLSAPALTDKDREDIKTAVEIDVDYLAVSFPRCAEDMNQARQLVREAGGDMSMVAKIERAETVADDQILDDIILASDAVMVARGDLGVEIGDAQLIGVQKHLIERARILNRCVITATQMMETMISSPMPTRAEVFDVANAVLDGTDAVMLSAETAAGKYPVQTVEAMVRVIRGAEKHPRAETRPTKPDGGYVATDQAIASATMYTARQTQKVKCIVAMTESGTTPLLMSRYGSRLPIFAFSRYPATLRKAALFRGVQPVLFQSGEIPYIETNARALEILMEKEGLEDGDLVLITKGDSANVHGGTNTMKILQVGTEIT
ncbi:pyruvate kinase [Teredinibacter franksiae]|uniref:Pyruvate kinase n=1 Tax=Cellvibrionaceae bacterium Bsc2 TaxID=1500540 RepID=A0A0D3MFD9_9GAMM|nr:pyruvate kinase [Teredinibacter franksiae]AIH07683.1 pyruvate kinase [Cellvibrionaceae bacterium Bsc2]